MVGLETLSPRSAGERESAVLLATSRALARWDRAESSEQLLRDLALGLGMVAGVLWLAEDETLFARLTWSADPIDRSALDEALGQLRFPPGVGLLGSSWKRGETLYQPPSAAEDEWSLASARGGLFASVAVPVRTDDEILGAVELYVDSPDELGTEPVLTLPSAGYAFGALLALERRIAPSPLSARELELLALASEGLTVRGIAERVSISPATVKTHFEHIYSKLRVHDRAAAVACALRGRMIE